MIIPGAGGVCKALRARRRGAASCAPCRAPFTPDELFARLDALGIAHRTYSHPPVFTVAEAAALRGSLPGGHCKSLFLKDKKGGLWLVVALEERRIDLKRLADALGAPRFSFGSRRAALRGAGRAAGQRHARLPWSTTPRIAVSVVLDAGDAATTTRSTTIRSKTTARRR